MQDPLSVSVVSMQDAAGVLLALPIQRQPLLLCRCCVDAGGSLFSAFLFCRCRVDAGGSLDPVEAVQEPEYMAEPKAVLMPDAAEPEIDDMAIVDAAEQEIDEQQETDEESLTCE
ncbi:GL21114 [Drosophila persimilis]|uniref:GL21114 n=1 Tax=Drosophila persimilis TaxID=7234 RepID=B4GWU6_DROPE|nr:GL21114 [Drosophila persimilis]